MLGALFLREACLVALAASRIGGFVVVSPFPGSNTPKSSKVGLVVLLAWFVVSSRPADGEPPSVAPSFDLIPLVATELTIGLLVGLAFRVVLAAAEIGGEIASQATGLGAASLFNPTTHGEETPVSRLLWISGSAVMVASGTHRVVLGYLLETFRAIPFGSTLQPSAATGVFVELVAGSMVTGLRLALPVVAVALVAQVALALIARSAPALGVFQIGLPILIAVGLAVLALSYPTISSILLDTATSVPRAIDQVLGAAA